MKSTSPASRLMRRVEKTESCWLWRGRKNKKGYGRITSGPHGNQEYHYVHRVSWEMHNGPIPNGMHVLHRCDVPNCVRPDHLFLGSNEDNMKDMWSKGRHRWGTKLTAQQVEAIRKDIGGGEFGILVKTAKKFGVSPQAISKIKNGHSWSLR